MFLILVFKNCFMLKKHQFFFFNILSQVFHHMPTFSTQLQAQYSKIL